MGDGGLEELRASGGKPAKALISATKAGKKLKGDPSQIVWKVTLRVTPEDAGPFDAVIQVPYPVRGGGPSLGTLVGVLYDPRNHKNICVDPTVETASWGQVQAGMQQHVIEQAMSRSAGGASSWAASGSKAAPSPSRRAPPGHRRPRPPRASPTSSSAWPPSGTRARSPTPSSRPRRRSSSARRPPPGARDAAPQPDSLTLRRIQSYRLNQDERGSHGA